MSKSIDDILGDNFEAEPAGYFNFEEAKREIYNAILALPEMQENTRRPVNAEQAAIGGTENRIKAELRQALAGLFNQKEVE